MSNAAKSIFVFNIYRITLGITLLVIPSVLMSLFGLETENEFAFRLVGFMLVMLGGIYLQAARDELTKFFRFSVISRSLVLLFFIVLAIFGIAKPILILFGVVELLGAIWTRIALRSA